MRGVRGVVRCHLQDVLSIISSSSQEYWQAVMEALKAGVKLVPVLRQEGKQKFSFLLRSWREEYDPEQVLEVILQYRGNENLVLLTPAVGFSVVDVDCIEKFESFVGLPISEFVEQAKEEFVCINRSVRGYHFWVLEQLPSANSTLDEHGFEIRSGEGQLIALPQPPGKEKYYRNVSVNPTAQPRELLQQILAAAYPEQEKDELEQEQVSEAVESDIKEMTEIVTSCWVEGQRQTLAMALAGFLAWRGWRQEQVEELIRQVCVLTGDREVKQRLSAVRNTYKRKEQGQNVVGKSLLKQLLPNEVFQVLDRITRKNRSLEWLTDDIASDGTYLYFTKEVEEVDPETGGVKKQVKKELLGPAIVPVRYQYFPEQQRYKTVWRYKDAEFYLPSISPSEIEKQTGVEVVKPTRYKAALAELRKKRPPQAIIVLTNTGWRRWGQEEKEVLATPYTLREGVEWQHKLPQLWEPPRNTGMQHNLVRQVLREGKVAACVIVHALSAILLKPCGLDGGYCCMLTGLRGTGKTTWAKFASQLFYRLPRAFTMLGTTVGLEQTFASLKDLPVLLDEGALMRDERAQELLFMVAAGEGKKRSNPQLGVRVTELRSVMLVTSETDFRFDRKGATRRFVQYHITSKEDLSSIPPKDVAELNRVTWGAGTDYILYFQQHRDEILTRTEEKLVELEQYQVLPGDAPLWIPTIAALVLLEQYYQENYTNTWLQLTEVMALQKQELEKKPWEMLLEDFLAWVAENVSSFEVPGVTVQDGRYFVKSPCLGAVFPDKNEIFILPAGLDRFCRAYSWNKELVLRQLEQHELLKRSGEAEGRRTCRRKLAAGTRPRGYLVSLPGDVTLALEAEEF